MILGIHHLKHASFCSLLVFFLSAGSAAACDQVQATNKMMALMNGLEKLQQDGTLTDPVKIVAANERANEAGNALATGDYDEACKIYDETAKDYGVEMPE